MADDAGGSERSHAGDDDPDGTSPPDPRTEERPEPPADTDAEDRAGVTEEATAGSREVVVPEELFRIVVVFSTVLSILAILLGFVLLDAATRVVENPTGSVFVDLVRVVTGWSLAGVEPHLATIALAVGLGGVACVGLGVWIYAVGTRFRTEMGKPKQPADEGSDNG